MLLDLFTQNSAKLLKRYLVSFLREFCRVFDENRLMRVSLSKTNLLGTWVSKFKAWVNHGNFGWSYYWGESAAPGTLFKHKVNLNMRPWILYFAELDSHLLWTKLVCNRLTSFSAVRIHLLAHALLSHTSFGVSACSVQFPRIGYYMRFYNKWTCAQRMIDSSRSFESCST